LSLIGFGALFKLLGKGRSRELGMALAGFGMLFLGLNMLQEGMQGLSGMFQLSSIPAGGVGAYLLIVLIGLALTAVLQSSTAAIAMTLTALDAGAISFDQAAAVVIGASIGTTLTGVLVSIGGTVYAKRTAVAYILFNTAAGLLGLLLLPLFLPAIYVTSEYLGILPGPIALAAFHSLFIALGALFFLPMTQRFAQLVERLLPEQREETPHYLDNSMLSLPTVALEASQRTIEGVAGRLINLYGGLLEAMPTANSPQVLQQNDALLNAAYEFATRIQLPPDDEGMHQRRSAQLHAIDHLLRLNKRLESMLRSEVSFDNILYRPALTAAKALLALVEQGLSGQGAAGWTEQLAVHAGVLAGLLEQVRSGLLAGASVEQDASYSLHTADIYRWFERTAHHIWRASHYLAISRTDVEAGNQAS